MLTIDLQSLRVLIARPIRQAQTLASMLSACNAKSFVYPVLCIEQIAFNQTEFNHAVANSDVIIFTSCNAVWQTAVKLLYYQRQQSLPQLIAIGPATADAIAEEGLPLANKPTSEFSSEGLLDIPLLHSCYGKRILILSGVGGRTVLIDELTARGAVVEKLAVYRRCHGIKPSKEMLATWQQPGIDVVISTSGEGLSQLVKQISAVGKSYHDWLLTQQLLVMSQRLVPLVQQYGFTCQPLVATQASDVGLITALANFLT